jgi:hypothetical protein
MAGEDLRKKFTLHFEQKGAEAVSKIVDKLNEGLSPEAMGGGMEELDKSTRRTIQSVDKLTRAMERMRKLQEKAEKRTPQTTQPAAQGGFMQGVLQGGGFGPFLQRGPGMYRQAAGMGIGRMGRGFAGGAASMPFRGLAGVSQGLMSIPGGGLVSAALSNAMGTASSQLQYQTARLGFGGYRAPSALLAEANRARSGVMGRNVDEFTPTYMRGSYAEEVKRQAGRGEAGQRNLNDPAWHAQMRRFGTTQAEKAPEEGARRQRAAAEAAADRVMRADPMRQFQMSAQRLSVLNRTEALQFASQMGLSGLDRTFGTAQGSGNLRSSLAAQTLGIGNAASLGGFIRGRQRGGVVGGDLEDTIEGAMEAGMNRSEANELLQVIASGQQQFLQTGMPINTRSLLDMGRAVTGAFRAGGRSSAIAQQLGAAGRTLADRGPQSAADFLALRVFGGFDNNTLESYQAARRRLESGEAFQDDPNTPQNEARGRFMQFAGQAAGSVQGGPAARSQALQTAFRNFGSGIRLGVAESDRLERILRLGPQNAQDRAFIEQQTSQLGGAFDLQGEAERLVGGASGRRRAADLENRRIGIGAEMLPIVQKFENATLKTAGAITKLEPALNALGDGANTVAGYLPGIAQTLQNILGALGGTNAPMSSEPQTEP